MNPPVTPPNLEAFPKPRVRLAVGGAGVAAAGAPLWKAEPPRTPRIAVIMVTWNRREAASEVVRALAAQAYPAGEVDVVVVDNGSTDGAAEYLAERWRAERIVENPTERADEPDFGEPRGGGGRNLGGFASLTIIHNHRNHGGCGGFNTGFAFVERFLDGIHAPEYLWLVDDDIDLPADALARLTATAESDGSIGLVGSRTVDLRDRRTTIESTIYFDFEEGWMGPDPTPGHALAGEHREWVEAVGGTRGERAFSGVRDVDVVSACSLLARWSAVKGVGYWDRRFFIYCDDADWCLRFARAGHRVVCDLDAVVYHTPWLYKLTPARSYYSQRNLLWVMQKTLPRERLRGATLRRLTALLLQSRKAASHCRLFHAEIIRRTAHDVVAGRGGALEDQGPAPMPLGEALERAGALGADRTVLVMCTREFAVEMADGLRARVSHILQDAGRLEDQPRWVYMVKEGVPDAGPCGAVRSAGGVFAHPERIVFRPNKRSKLRAQARLLLSPPDLVVVFDQSNEFPLLRSRWNLHADHRRPGEAQLERDGLAARGAFLARWAWTALRCLLYSARVRPYVAGGKYG